VVVLGSLVAGGLRGTGRVSRTIEAVTSCRGILPRRGVGSCWRSGGAVCSALLERHGVALPFSTPRWCSPDLRLRALLIQAAIAAFRRVDDNLIAVAGRWRLSVPHLPSVAVPLSRRLVAGAAMSWRVARRVRRHPALRGQPHRADADAPLAVYTAMESTCAPRGLAL